MTSPNDTARALKNWQSALDEARKVDALVELVTRSTASASNQGMEIDKTTHSVIANVGQNSISKKAQTVLQSLSQVVVHGSKNSSPSPVTGPGKDAEGLEKISKQNQIEERQNLSQSFGVTTQNHGNDHYCPIEPLASPTSKSEIPINGMAALFPLEFGVIPVQDDHYHASKSAEHGLDFDPGLSRKLTDKQETGKGAQIGRRYSIEDGPSSTQIADSKDSSKTEQNVALKQAESHPRNLSKENDTLSMQTSKSDKILHHPPNAPLKDVRMDFDPQIQENAFHEEKKYGKEKRQHEQLRNKDHNGEGKAQDFKHGDSTQDTHIQIKSDDYVQMADTSQVKNLSPQNLDAGGVTPDIQSKYTIYDAIDITGVPQNLGQLKAIASQLMESSEWQKQSDYLRHGSLDRQNYPNYTPHSENVYETLKRTDEFSNLEGLQHALSKFDAPSTQDTWSSFHRYNSLKEASSHIRLAEWTGLLANFSTQQAHQNDVVLNTLQNSTMPPANNSSSQGSHVFIIDRTQHIDWEEKHLRYQNARIALLDVRASLPIAAQNSYVNWLNKAAENAIKTYNQSTPYVPENGRTFTPKKATAHEEV